MTVHEYEKRLHTNNYISKKCFLGRIELHLVFQKVTKNQKQVDFLGFYTLMKTLKVKCEEKKESSCGATLREFIQNIDIK